MSEGQGQFEAEIKEDKIKEDKMARDGKFVVLENKILLKKEVEGGEKGVSPKKSVKTKKGLKRRRR